MRGHMAYSFHNYFVLGIAEYAQEVDGIGTGALPDNLETRVLYAAGFNRGMLGKIRGRLGSDFPDGYVQRFVKDGWLDCTKGQPTQCPVHGVRLETAVIPFQVVYPLTMAREKFDWEVVAEREFPFPGKTMKVDASLTPRPANARVRICQRCTEAEREWWSSNGRQPR